MKSKDHQSTIFVAALSLLIILAIYAFAGMSGDTLFAYPGPNSTSTSNTTNGYPGPNANDTGISAYPAPDQTFDVTGNECIPPIDPTSDIQKAIDPCATPIPLPSPTVQRRIPAIPAW